MTEDRNENREKVHPPWEKPIDEEYSFDELARGLANGTISRGRALKLVGGAILGGALLSLWPGEAQAHRRRRRHHHHHHGGGGGGGCGPGRTPCRRPNGNVVCCQSNETCSNKGCIRECNNFTTTTCLTTATTDDPHACAGQTTGCKCFRTTEGGSFCVNTTSSNYSCANTACPNGTSDCPAGSTCIQGGLNTNCCLTNVCVPASASCT